MLFYMLLSHMLILHTCHQTCKSAEGLRPGSLCGCRVCAMRQKLGIEQLPMLTLVYRSTTLTL